MYLGETKRNLVNTQNRNGTKFKIPYEYNMLLDIYVWKKTSRNVSKRQRKAQTSEKESQQQENLS